MACVKTQCHNHHFNALHKKAAIQSLLALANGMNMMIP
jgi:hypothetical protein